jgi:hypothetical protein
MEWNHYKWDNNTVILADSVKVTATGQSVPAAAVVSTGALAPNSAEVESYEGSLVQVKDATITSINPYDVTVDDGSGPALIDGDGLVAKDNAANGTFYVNQAGGYLVADGDTLRKNDKISFVQGVFTFSFGTYKISLRKISDFGTVTGVNDNPPSYPLSFNLEQNFPNPFNPETRIYFTVPTNSHVKIVIYNSLGQIVRRLVDENYSAGQQIVNWDGRNDFGQVVPSGIYFYRMKAGDYMALKKMMMLK